MSFIYGNDFIVEMWEAFTHLAMLQREDNKSDKSNSLASQCGGQTKSAGILNGPCDKKDNVEKK